MGNALIEKRGEALVRLCRNQQCREVVESTLHGYFATSPLETVRCPQCGECNAVRPSLSYRWKRGWGLWRKHHRVYGWRWQHKTRKKLVHLFMMPWEIDRVRRYKYASAGYVG